MSLKVPLKVETEAINTYLELFRPFGVANSQMFIPTRRTTGLAPQQKLQLQSTHANAN